MLTEQIRRLAERQNFRPFKLRTSSGSEFTISSRDHISFGPSGVIGVWNQRGTACTWLAPTKVTEVVDQDPLEE
jgi:hypothetical protein